MSKDWNHARNALKEALRTQKSMLKDMERVGYTDADREVRSIKRNIRDIEHDLRTTYSLAV